MRLSPRPRAFDSLMQWFSTGGDLDRSEGILPNVSTWGGGCYHQWVEAKDAAKHSTVHTTVPQQRHAHPKLSKVLRLINFGLMEVLEM